MKNDIPDFGSKKKKQREILRTVPFVTYKNQVYFSKNGSGSDEDYSDEPDPNADPREDHKIIQ